MSKTKIKLLQAIALKNKLEKRINSIDWLISSNNSIISTNTRSVDIEKLMEERIKSSNLLIELNIIIQKANLLKGKDEKECNTYYIKKLSELERELTFWTSLNTTDGVKIINKKSGKTLKYDAFYKGTTVNKRIKEIQDEISTINNKLTLFSSNITVEVELDPSLEITV